MATNIPQDDFHKTGLRLPRDLHAAIHTEAAESGRSYNSQIVHILQSYFDDIEDGVARLSAGLEKDKAEMVSFGLGEPGDRAAVIKVLLLEEIGLLRNRIEHLGGREAVLTTPKGDLVKRMSSDRIQGTLAERQSYFSQVVGSFPLTALLTSEEIERLAQRVAAVQDAHKSIAKIGHEDPLPAALIIGHHKAMTALRDDPSIEGTAAPFESSVGKIIRREPEAKPATESKGPPKRRMNLKAKL